MKRETYLRVARVEGLLTARRSCHTCRALVGGKLLTGPVNNRYRVIYFVIDK